MSWFKPTIKDFEKILRLSQEDAELAYGLIKGTISYRQVLHADTNEDKPFFKSVSKWLRSCYNEPNKDEVILEMFNALLEGHGIEAIRDSRVWNNYSHDIIVVYVNMGDPYTSTIVYEMENSRFLLISWGDFVEFYESKHGKIQN